MKKNNLIEITKSLIGLNVFYLEGDDVYICFFPDYSGVDTERILSDIFSIVPEGIKHQTNKNGQPEIGVMFKSYNADYAAGLCKVAMLRLQMAR